MPNQLYQKSVNIAQYPKEIIPLEGEVTIGDLHGNALKLLFILITHGIATGLTEDDYATLVWIYQTRVDQLTQCALQQFDEIVSRIVFKTHLLIRLIGDELADRGSNDYFTLKIIDQMHKGKVPFEILLSNHGLDFISVYERGDRFDQGVLQFCHAASMQNLQGLIDRKLVSRQTISDIVEQSYKPALRILSYSLSSDRQAITIYSHAPIGWNAMRALYKRLRGDVCQYNTALDVAKIITTIQETFKTYVFEKKIHTLCDANVIQQFYRSTSVRCDKDPVSYILWNRSPSLDRQSLANHSVNFVHGHHNDNQTAKVESTPEMTVYNLDETLGKDPSNLEGALSFLHSPPGTPKDQVPFLVLLQDIKSKKEGLGSAGFKTAKDAADALHQALDIAFKALNDKDNPIGLDKFKTTCNEAINKARPVLAEYRGWNLILIHVLLVVMTIGIAPLVNKGLNGRFTFFKTDSERRLDAISDCLQRLDQKILA